MSREANQLGQCGHKQAQNPGPHMHNPSAKHIDVLVIGGGPAGVGAAFAAARLGAKVLVVEQFNCLGGVGTAAGHGHMAILCAWQTQTRVVGGIAHEICRRIADEGYGRSDHYGTWYEVEGLKFIYDTMARESGVEVLYHTFFCETIMEGNRAVGAVVQNKTGRYPIYAKRVIDCTGDGDVAFSAGAPCEVGRTGDHRCQPVTLMFTIGGVDWPRVEEARKPDWKMTTVWELAQKNGDMEPFQNQVMGFWWTPTRPDQVGVNFTHMIKIDTTKAEDLSAATIEGRRQAWHMIPVFRKYVPGMKNCYMLSTPSTVGLRESRRAMGDYLLTEDDMRAHREFEDSIGYGSFFIDIHNLDGPGMAKTTRRPDPGFKYQIPFRILCPQKVESLLVAGRCVSVTHVGLGSLRVMIQCILMGEAAGTAAALSIRQNVAARQVDLKTLQAELRARGGILSEADIAKANAPTAATSGIPQHASP